MDIRNSLEKETYQHDEGIENGEKDLINDVVYDEKETKRILRKIDIRILPVLTLLYLMAFLDRGNSTLGITCTTQELTFCASWKCKSRWDERHFEIDRSPIQSLFDNLLLPIFIVRSTKQHHAQTTQTCCLATNHRPVLGNSNDPDGYRAKLSRPSCSSFLFGIHRGTLALRKLL